MNKKTEFLKIPFALLEVPELSMSARILMAQILEFNARGKCFASNAFLGELLGISQRTIAEGIKELKEKSFVTARKEGTKRLLFPVYSKLCECGICTDSCAESAVGQCENRAGRVQNPQSGYAESAQYNNNYNNNYNNIYYCEEREKNKGIDYSVRSYDLEALERIE